MVDMSKRIVTFGEILLRLSPPSHLRLTQATSFDLYYGCAEANVAASLSKFGLPVKFITAVPSNELGESSLSMLRSFGVDPIATIQGKRLGIYYFEQGASERPDQVASPGLIPFRSRNLTTSFPEDSYFFNLGVNVTALRRSISAMFFSTASR